MAYIPGAMPRQIRRRSPFSRQVRAALRDTIVLMREFRDALIVFTLAVVVGAVAFRSLWKLTRPPIPFAEALYNVLGMTFFNSPIEFPDEWYLQLYFFLMPAVGLALLARGAADFVTLLFN